ncbi:ubiquinone/menaquinone biosynthesis C-methyltransferase UbiE-like [Dysidea avara]|uniref:ubiquinone/menaquinone biosynthesis C-methyltransferase UbiE-like n=1 Tax=Dysidea avara TaxID=196820 RepID=UPI00331718D5
MTDLYGSDGVKSYDKYCEKEPVIQAFLCPAMEEFLKSEVPGKKQDKQHHMVNIKVGDVVEMPYGDETFDIAMSLYVTCNLDRERLSKHFKELYRVLKPGGKAVIINLAEKSVDKMYLTVSGDEVVVKGKINKNQIDNIYTEERMVLYNQTHPESQLSKSVVDHPLAFISIMYQKHCQTANLTTQQN